MLNRFKQWARELHTKWLIKNAEDDLGELHVTLDYVQRQIESHKAYIKALRAELAGEEVVNG